MTFAPKVHSGGGPTTSLDPRLGWDRARPMASAGAPPPPPPGAPPGRGARPSAASQRPAAADDISEIEEVGPRVELRRDAEWVPFPAVQWVVWWLMFFGDICSSRAGRFSWSTPENLTKSPSFRFWQQPEAQRERSLSFDDVYALAPTQAYHTPKPADFLVVCATLVAPVWHFHPGHTSRRVFTAISPHLRMSQHFATWRGVRDPAC